MSTTRKWTEAELMALPEDGFKRELVDGEIVVSPAGAPHGLVILALASRIMSFAQQRRLGRLFDSSTGVWMPSGNLRSPDLTFVSRETMPGDLPEGFLRAVPDLVVEVLSPGDSKRGIAHKVQEYLDAGVRLVWVIDRMARQATAHSAAGVTQLGEDDDLDGGDVLPGFRCKLGEIFP